MRLMVIDHDPAVADGLRQSLAERGLAAELTIAEGAADALRRLRLRPGAHDALLADPGDWPGRLAQAVAEVRAAAPQAAFLALLDPRSRLDREGALAAGFDDAFVKHPRTYPALGRLLVELTERLALTRQQLRLSQARADAELLLAALMAASDAGVAVLDAEEGALTVANGRFCRLVGRPLADILGRPLWPLLDPAGAAALRAALAAAPDDGSAAALPLALTLAGAGDDGADLPTAARLAVRELGSGHRSAVMTLRPADPPAGVAQPGHGPAAAKRLVEPIVEPSAEGLRAALRARANPLVVARIRLGESTRALARAGSLPPEIAAVLQQGLRDALAGLLGDGDLIFAHAEELHVLFAEDGDGALEATRRLFSAVPAARDALLRSPRLAHDLLAIGGARLAEQQGELSELQVTAAPLDLAPDDVGQEDLAGLLAARLLAEEATLGADVLRALNELRATARCELRMVQDQDGAPSALCLPRLDEAASARLAALAELAEARAEVALQLALLALELAVEALGREVDRDSALAVVDLRFSVLGQRRLADRFLDRCRTLPAGTTRALVVNLLGVPPGAYAPKFARVTAGLHDLFRLRALTLRDIRADLVDLDLGRIGLLIADYGDLEPFLDDRQDLIQALVRRAHRSHARLLVRRVPRGLAAELRDGLGVDLTSSA